jgi:hypothetical protein
VPRGDVRTLHGGNREKGGTSLSINVSIDRRLSRRLSSQHNGQLISVIDCRFNIGLDENVHLL